MGRENHNPIILLDIDDLHIEAVLDSGFLDVFELAPDIHAHTYYELMLSPYGDFSIELSDGSVLPMDADTVCLIPPGVYHRTYSSSSTARKLAIRFYCTRAFKTGSVYAAFQRALEGRKSLLPLGRQQELLRIAAQLRRELQSSALARENCVQSLLTLLFIQLLRQVCREDRVLSAPDDMQDETSGRRLAIDEFFYAHYAEPITEQTLAAQMHLSKRQLSRVLGQLYGMSFRQILIDIRLNHAARLLTETDLPAEEIAGRAGYGSVSGFYEAFRKRYGISVGKYKSRLLE